MTSSVPSRASGYGKPSTWPAVLPCGRFLGQQGCLLLACSGPGRRGKEGSATQTPGEMLRRSQGVSASGKGLEGQGKRPADAPSAEQRLSSSSCGEEAHLLHLTWCRGRRAQLSLGLLASRKQLDRKASQEVTSAKACSKLRVPEPH